MRDHFAWQVVARVADPCGIGDLLHLGEIMLRAPGADRIVEDLAVAQRSALVLNRASSAKSGRCMISVAKRCHSRSLVVPSTTVWSSAGSESAVRRDGRRADAERLLVDAGMLGVGERVAHDVGHHVEQAQFDGTAPPPLADGRRARDSSARIEIAAYSPVVKSAIAGPGLAGMPG